MMELPELRQLNPARDELNRIISDLGVCPCCWQAFTFAEDEPIATCACGSGEWTSSPTIIERLRRLEREIPEFLE